MTITALPTPPSRNDPTNFSARGDAFLGALPDFATQANAQADTVNTQAALATASAAVAGAAAAAAGSAVAASKWVSGTTYAEGAVVWSPITYLSYRRKSAGAGTTDPSADTTNWAQSTGTGDVTLIGTQTLTNKTLTSPVITENIQIISSNTTAVRSRTYVFTATLTLTLPASPAAGDSVMFSNRSGTGTPIIARNGSNIMGLAENLTVDNVNYFGTLVYADATRGWIFQ